MALSPEIELCAIIGAFIGVMIGTLGPYYKEKKKLGYDDISIFFDKKFLKATVVAGILSAVGVGSIFPIVLANVNPLWSYPSTVIFSAALAFSLNIGGNVILSPSLITEAAKKKALEKQTAEVIDNQLNEASERIFNDMKRKQAEMEMETNKQELIQKIKENEDNMGMSDDVIFEDDDVIHTEPVRKVEYKEDKEEGLPSL